MLTYLNKKLSRKPYAVRLYHAEDQQYEYLDEQGNKLPLIDEMSSGLRGTKRRIDFTPMSSPGTPASSASEMRSNISSLTSKTGIGASQSAALVAASLNGRPTKARLKLAKKSKSKYSTDRFAHSLALKMLCPKISLHTTVTPLDLNLSCETGVQAVYNNNTLTYSFPQRDFLLQLAYKLNVDHMPWNRGSGFFGYNGLTGTHESYAAGPQAEMVLGGGTGTSARGYVASGLASTTTDPSHWDMPGLILKSMTRSYTFYNTGSSLATINIYEFVYTLGEVGDLSYAYTAYTPYECWAKDIKQTQFMGASALNGDNPYTNGQIAMPKNQHVLSVTDIGARPSKKMTLLNKVWKFEKITVLKLAPGQSAIHRVYIPGCYVSAIDLEDANKKFIKNKTRSVMFIINGEIGFDASATANKIISTTAHVNWKIESDVEAQGVPPNKRYVEYTCKEEDYADVTDNYTATTPATVRQSQFEAKVETCSANDNAEGGAISDGVNL